MSALFLLLACSDYDLNRTPDDAVYTADIRVDPAILSYGDVPEGEDKVLQFDILNVGNAALDVEQILIEGASSFTLMGDPPTGSLEPEAQVSVAVRYEAIQGEDASGFVWINSNDPDTPEAAVELVAGIGIAELRIEPNPYDFGTVSVGSTANGRVSLMNVGGADLTVSDLAVTSGPFDAWLDDSLPVLIPAGEEIDLRVSFTPASTASASAEFVVTHDAGGESYGSLIGQGDADLPVAVCSVAPAEVEPLGTPVTWLGRDSYDPNGLEITRYDWQLVNKPSGSAASMPGGDADRAGFVPDLAGTYEGQLTVTNEAGLYSAPCLATLEVVPAEDLWIEMFWVHSGDDMDLHLLAPGGNVNTSKDCYYANCVNGRLNWGSASSTLDDPSLDLDDIPGVGPENINIDEPETGTFTALVHDYPESSYQGGNDVTVKIYLSGALVWEDTRTISGENTFTDFAEIAWPSGAVTGL